MSRSSFVLKSRVPLALAAGALVLACVGCSAPAQGGGASSGGGGNNGSTGGSVAAACADKAKGPQHSDDRQTRLNNEVVYWDQVVKDAPPELRDTAMAADAAAKKVAAGDNSAATSKIYLQGVLDFSAWSTKNCKS